MLCIYYIHIIRYDTMESSFVWENWNHLFCRKVSFLTASHCQFRGVTLTDFLAILLRTFGLLSLTLVKFSFPMFRQLNGINNMWFLINKFVLNDKLRWL